MIFRFLTRKKIEQTLEEAIVFTNRQTNNKHAAQRANKVVCAPTQTSLSYHKYVKHTTHKRVKELYQHQWSYGVIQTVDHREAW